MRGRYQTQRQKPSGITEEERIRVSDIVKRNWHRGTPEQAEDEIKDMINQIKYREQG